RRERQVVAWDLGGSSPPPPPSVGSCARPVRGGRRSCGGAGTRPPLPLGRRSPARARGPERGAGPPATGSLLTIRLEPSRTGLLLPTRRSAPHGGRDRHVRRSPGHQRRRCPRLGRGREEKVTA